MTDGKRRAAGARTSVVLVVNRPSAREALARSLGAAGFDVLDAVGSAEALLRRIPPLQPHVAVVGLALPGMSGLELTRRLRDLVPPPAVLVRSAYDDAAHVVEAVLAGASGYLLERTPPEEFVPAVRAVRAGHAPFSPEVARHLLARVRGAPEGADPHLTLREREVLTLLARGHAYADVARALGVRLTTVQSHVRRLYRKLEVSSKAEAAVVALRRGLVGR